MKFNSVLCVCTGNICRSPVAEAYLRRALPAVTIASAGIGALVGQGADEQALQIADREGLELSAHSAQQIDNTLAGRYDIILVMEREQLDWIRTQFPQASGRVFMVSQWRDREDVSDPFRRSGEYFDKVYRRLASCLDDWIDKLNPERSRTA